MKECQSVPGQPLELGCLKGLLKTPGILSALGGERKTESAAKVYSEYKVTEMRMDTR